MTPEKNSRKGGGVRVTYVTPFLGLTVKISKIAKCLNIKFGMHAPWQSPDMTPEKKLSTDSLYFFKNPILVPMVTKIWEFDTELSVESGNLIYIGPMGKILWFSGSCYLTSSMEF